MGKADVRSFTPGPHWRATKRWQNTIRAVMRLGPRGFKRLVARNLEREAKRREAHQRHAEHASGVCVCCGGQSEGSGGDEKGSDDHVAVTVK